MTGALVAETIAMREALLNMTRAVYEGTDDDRKTSLFDLLTAWGLLLDSITKDEREGNPL